MKCNNCGHCQEHCECDWECGKCEFELYEREIIEEEFEDEEPEHICCSECSCWEEEPEQEPIEEDTDDTDTDIIYCYE